MASSDNDDELHPGMLVTRPTEPLAKVPSAKAEWRSRLLHRNTEQPNPASAIRPSLHVRLQEPANHPGSSTSSIYLGSFGHHSRRSRSSIRTPNSIRSPASSVGPSSRNSLNHAHLSHLLGDLNQDLDTYGVEELREGFFDAQFFKPAKEDKETLLRLAEYSLPTALRKKQRFSSVSTFFELQYTSVCKVVKEVCTTRASIHLTKSFLGFFIAYILCLVPVIQQWLGRYNYFIVVSTLVNHPGRTVGAAIDGVILTILGSATGLGWGAFALWASDSTAVSRDGYGGILATFLVIFMVTLGALRSCFIRLYQFVLCAGIAISYTCLADTSTEVNWQKLYNYAIPFLFGQAICLLVAFTVFPEAGARPLAVSLHEALHIMEDGLTIPRPDNVAIHRELARTYVQLSQAYRDLVLDISVTKFDPSDVAVLRNLMQGVIRNLITLRTTTKLFEINDKAQNSDTPPNGDAVIGIDNPRRHHRRRLTGFEEEALKVVARRLADPTENMLDCMREALRRTDAVLMDMSSYRKYLGPDEDTSSDVVGALTKLRQSMIKFDQEDETLIGNPLLPSTYSNHPELVELFLFIHPVRQTAASIEKFVVKVNQMQQRRRGWAVHFPSYSWSKALQRTNRQVRHDRGGVTASFFFNSQRRLQQTMRRLQMTVYTPTRRDDGISEKAEVLVEDDEHSPTSTMRYKIWAVMHRLQGFETRYSLKVGIITSLLAIPAWVQTSRGWWNDNEIWWAVVMVWIMMHPRSGGNFQDLLIRTFCVLLGSAWGGFAFAARNGNSYVMAVFAAIFMIPMMYRYTQSKHPRSGIAGCLAFTVISLSEYTVHSDSLNRGSVAKIAWTRGVAFIVGIVASVIVNWLLWPFVARHELRKSLSAMMLHCAIVYRGVVAKYIYYEDGDAPNSLDVTNSEQLEGQLREGFVRIRQLLALTRHEIRLRAPFEPLPYSALIEACEHFFECLVDVRLSSLFFKPNYLTSVANNELLSFRRDAVAAILMNLYVLAGALRGDRPVPRYLPSAIAARKKLLEKMAEVEDEDLVRREEEEEDGKGAKRRWADVYQYAYSAALTDIVDQLEQMRVWTTKIVGERGFDLPVVDGEVDEGWISRPCTPK